MASVGIDRAYTNLLEHLNHPKSSVSHDVVFSSIPYYLSQLPLPHPTQLTAFFISSALWKRLTLGELKAIIGTFRTAVHLKHAKIQKAGKWFLQSPQQQLAEWMNAVLKGISRGNPQLKFAMLGGMLIAFQDLGDDAISLWKRDKIQRQVILACAELMETLSDTADPWEQEFSSSASSQFQTRETMFLYSCYIILPSLGNEMFSALNVQKLARIAQHGVERSFMSGQILSFGTESLKKENNKVVIQPGSPLIKTTEAILNDQLYQDAAPLAKLLARCLSSLGNQDSRSALQMYKIVVERMENINLEVKRCWNSSILSTITSDDDVLDDSLTKQITTDIWKILKTLLFSQLMVLQTIIASLLFFKPSVFPRHISAATIASVILRSLHNQAFIISQFGGIAAMSDGFKELKRVTYSTLDIIDAEFNCDQQMELINHLLSSLQESRLPRNHPSYQAETAFTLTVVEQLIPKLTDEMIEEKVIPFAIMHLDNVQHRDSFESAHSLVLAIFASRAKKQQMNHSMNAESPTIVDKLAPFYTDSLIKNSEEGKLSVDQLRLAYSNLIRAVSSESGNDVLTWFCIASLLSNINSRPTTSSRMPLCLTLISLISCAPRSLLLKVLDEVKTNLEAVGGSTGPSPERDEMTRAIQDEIMNRVDDLDKETVLRWWMEDIVSKASDNA